MVTPNQSNTTADALSAFVDAVRTTNILLARQSAKLDALLARGDHSTEPGEFAARLVKEGILTEYQAKQILKGKQQGLVFGGYVILDFLGKGTMGKVYKAMHRMMGRTVALKILEPRYVTSTRSLARFQREMQLVGRLDHPNVVRAFDADKFGDCHFIAMEYAEGYTLEDLLKAKGTLAPADVVYFASQAAEGLAHAHAQGVIHRDIKPSNLVVTQGKKVKVLDFGLGTLLEGEDQSSALTSAGMAVGTPDYISPEQARTLKLDGRSDLYSLGCTMYHLLSGQLPFKGESSMDCIIGRITGKPIPIKEVMPGLPSKLIEVIDKLMATNPDERYQTADEAASALRGLLRPKNASGSRQIPSVPPAQTAATSSTSTASTTTATPAAAPEPVPEEIVTMEVALPPRGAARAPKAKADSRKAAGMNKGMLAAAAVAAVALLAIGLGVLFWPSGGEPQPSGQPPVANSGGAVPTVSTDVGQPNPADQPAQPAGTVAANDEAAPSPAAAPAPEVRKPSLVIESPRAGATVNMREQLTGRIESPGGWPVIFVQADIPGQPWWCQAPVAQVDGGKFTTNVVFGDEMTPSGMKFRVAAILTKTREDAQKFPMGFKQQSLPEGYPQSAEIVVTHR